MQFQFLARLPGSVIDYSGEINGRRTYKPFVFSYLLKLIVPRRENGMLTLSLIPLCDYSQSFFNRKTHKNTV